MSGTELIRYDAIRMHGGASTGPRTPEGLERTRKAWGRGMADARRLVEFA